MKYVVVVEGRELQVEVDGERVVVDGRELRAGLSLVPGTPLRQLVLDGRSMVFSVAPDPAATGRGHWVLSRRGEEWAVEVVDERSHHIRSLTGSGQRRSGSGAVRAPMPGLVVRVGVAVGDRVEAGSSLVVLEAMKMENELRATAAGVVLGVKVEAGQPVEKGAVLLELGPVGESA